MTTETTTTQPAIQVHGLEESYQDLHVLRGVDFDVAPGGIFALLGSNGAGKTTAVKIMSTLLKADSGSVAVNGFDVAEQPADVRASISLTGQFAAVDEILTGRENLEQRTVLPAHSGLGAAAHRADRDRGDGDRLPSRHHRRILRGITSDSARLPASPTRAAHLCVAHRSDLRPVDQLGAHGVGADDDTETPRVVNDLHMLRRDQTEGTMQLDAASFFLSKTKLTKGDASTMASPRKGLSLATSHIAADADEYLTRPAIGQSSSRRG